MRKVLQRTPASGAVLFAAPANAYPPLSLLSRCSVPCHKPKPSSPLSAQARGLVSVGSVINRGNSPRTGIISRDSLVCSTLQSRDVIAMPASSAAAVFDFNSCVSHSVNTSLPLSERQFVVVAKSCRISPGSINGVGCGMVVARPWVILKKIHDGTSRFAWLHTAAGGEDDSISTEGVSGLLDDGCESQREEEGEREDVSKADNSDEKPSKFSRRRRAGGNNQGTVLQESVDLLTIPGVGPRNLRKLVQKGIGKVAELKQLYRDKFLGESNQKMVEYLQGSVGIIHRNHAESITTFIKESVDDDEEPEDGGGSRVGFPKERITLCVEGNISVGKTTFLQRIANETLELQDLVEIVPEPIDKWQNVGPDHLNILDAFYADPQRYAYTFQNYVFVTRVMQERDSSSGIKPLRLMERSVFSDRMVFVRAVHEAKWMNEMEISIYDSWFDPVVSSLPGLIPDGFIYLRASPDTCHKRMMLRKREEEGGVSLDYLRGLHEKHESWLFPFESGNHGVLSVNQLPLSLDGSLHPDIKDRVFYLEGSHMHSSIQKVPALILDCEPNIDFNRDIEAKRHYAKQVAEFFAFVKKKKELDSPGDKGPPGSKGDPNNPTVAPSQGLWLPDGKQLLNMPFQSLDFSQGMSFV